MFPTRSSKTDTDINHDCVTMQTYNTGGAYFYLIGSGYFWFLAAFLAELVQSFILADFCYYYILR